MSIDYLLLRQKFKAELSHIGKNNVSGCEMFKDPAGNIYSLQNEVYIPQPKFDIEILRSGTILFEFNY